MFTIQSLGQGVKEEEEMIEIARWTVVLFGIFLIAVGVLMLVDPLRARATLRKAGSTVLINYGEITIRMIPAAAMVIFADASNYPTPLRTLGWFMLATSIVLYFVPRRLHHAYALTAATYLTPTVIRWISPLSLLFGGALIYATLG